MFNKPLISVCIPVYGTEALLEGCIQSVLEQDFTKIELIVVDDGSIPENGQLSSSAIIKKIKKSTKIPINFIEHKTNLGLLEARRSAIYEAKGKYIFILDSDDTIPKGALKALYNKAAETDADIIQGKAFFTGDSNLEILTKKENQFNSCYSKPLNVSDASNSILDEYLINKNINGFLWAKLIKREIYLEALGRIPPITCTFAEDVIQSIWIYNFTKTYEGIEDKVYNYSVSSGISSRKIITDLSRWEKVCTTASVFTAIFTECEENGNPFTQEQMAAIKFLCQKYVANNLFQLEKAVAPEIQEEAYALLCEYWGEDLVKYVENKLEDNSASKNSSTN